MVASPLFLKLISICTAALREEVIVIIMGVLQDFKT